MAEVMQRKEIREVRNLLRNRGKIDPKSAAEYAARGGFEGLRKALAMESPEIIETVKASGLRGRGGAGFPTWRKMQFTGTAEDPIRYIVCNADEGEPGTNKDRILLSSDPCSVFEGMAICGKAVGAHTGYVYLRAEYTYIFPIMQAALEDAERLGYLGKNMMGSGYDFEIKFRSGAGAYVCGEETALFESIEGKRGEPRFRPPFPSIRGLFGKPTMRRGLVPTVRHGKQPGDQALHRLRQRGAAGRVRIPHGREPEGHHL